MKEVLTSDRQYPFLDVKAAAALEEWRGDLGRLLARSGDALLSDGETVLWWTFAGGRINQTLKYAIEWKGGFKVVPDNFSIKIEGDGLSAETVARVLAELRAPGFWDDPEVRRKLLALLPEYRLSKFQRVLPEAWQVELVGSYLLDFDGTAEWLTGVGSRS